MRFRAKNITRVYRGRAQNKRLTVLRSANARNLALKENVNQSQNIKYLIISNDQIWITKMK